jgi:hypothetical protein
MPPSLYTVALFVCRLIGARQRIGHRLRIERPPWGVPLIAGRVRPSSLVSSLQNDPSVCSSIVGGCLASCWLRVCGLAPRSAGHRCGALVDALDLGRAEAGLAQRFVGECGGRGVAPAASAAEGCACPAAPRPTTAGRSPQRPSRASSADGPGYLWTGWVGRLLRRFETFTGKSFVIQPDDSFDDYAYGHERTQSNPQALPRAERRAVAAMPERTRTGGNVFLNRVAQVRFLSGPPKNSALAYANWYTKTWERVCCLLQALRLWWFARSYGLNM